MQSGNPKPRDGPSQTIFHTITYKWFRKWVSKMRDPRTRKIFPPLMGILTRRNSRLRVKDHELIRQAGGIPDLDIVIDPVSFQAEITERLGITKQTLWNWLQALSKPFEPTEQDKELHGLIRRLPVKVPVNGVQQRYLYSIGKFGLEWTKPGDEKKVTTESLYLKVKDSRVLQRIKTIRVTKKK